MRVECNIYLLNKNILCTEVNLPAYAPFYLLLFSAVSLY